MDRGLVVCRHERAHRYYALSVPTVLAAWDAYVGDDAVVEP